MEQTESTKQFKIDADALFATTTERMMAWANERLDARISRTTYSGDSPPSLQDVGKVFDTPRNGSSDTPNKSKTEE